MFRHRTDEKAWLVQGKILPASENGCIPNAGLLSPYQTPILSSGFTAAMHQDSQTGIGFNGQATIFYASRKNIPQKSPSQLDHQYEELADILSQTGLNVTCNKVRQAVKALYPAGLAQCPDEGMVIRDLFRYFKQWL